MRNRHIVFLKDAPTKRIFFNAPCETRRFTDKVGVSRIDSIWEEVQTLRKDGSKGMRLVWSSYKLSTNKQ